MDRGRRHSRGTGTYIACFTLLCALLVVLVPGAAAAVSRSAHGLPPASPQDPSRVHASAGATGTIALLDWQRVAGVSGYRIWRSMRRGGGFEPVGSSAVPEFRDASGIPGRTYFYRVTALLPDGNESALSTATGPISVLWNESPHTSSTTGNLCLSCHQLHDAAASDAILRSPRPSAPPSEVAICESCHDGQGALSNVESGPEDSFALASGHRIEEAGRGADSTNECSSCHSPHADPRKRPGMYRKHINGKTLAGGNSWCAACHDDADSWFKGYPAAGSTRRDAKGYPTAGTYPGPSVYADPAKNAHAALDAGPGRPKGDCLLCHAAHRGPNAYDGLLLTFRPTSASTLASDVAEGTYAEACLQCHAGQKEWSSAGAADVARYVTRQATDATYAGHRILTAGGTLPVGAPIPCYDCHNPHGSARGNAAMISDELGQRLSTASAERVREFCMLCHSSSDGLVRDSAASAYVAAGTRTFEGLRRDGTGGNALRLRSATGAAHASSDAQSCYDCHGDDYRTGGGNVHAPHARKGSGVTVMPAPSSPGVQPGTEKTATVPPHKDDAPGPSRAGTVADITAPPESKR